MNKHRANNLRLDTILLLKERWWTAQVTTGIGSEGGHKCKVKAGKLKERFPPSFLRVSMQNFKAKKISQIIIDELSHIKAIVGSLLVMTKVIIEQREISLLRILPTTEKASHQF